MAFIIAFVLLGSVVRGQGFQEEAALRGIVVPANPASFTGRGCAFADFDGDGDQDLVVAGGLGQALEYFRNDGAGWFSNRSVQSLLGASLLARGLAVADVDRDGDLDLYVCRSFGPNALYVNDGAGVFTEIGTAAGVDDPRASFHAAFADFDRDGHVDLYVANYLGSQGQPQPNRLYRNQGDGSFVDVAPQAGVDDAGLSFAATFVDVDDDGWLDLFVANDRGGHPAFPGNDLYRNQGDGSFSSMGAVWQAAQQIDAMGVAVGDVFNDGGHDLFVSNTAGYGHLFLRWNAPAQHYDEVATPLGLAPGGVGWSASFSDFDRDGWLDLHVVHSGTPDRLMRNPGTPTAPWTEVGAGLGVGLTDQDYVAAIADVDDDGRPDVFLPGFQTPARLLRNDTPGGSFLTLDLRGRASRRDAIGSVALVRTPGLTRRRMVLSTAGFQGGADLRLHFGLGVHAAAEVEIRWASGQRQLLGPVGANQVLVVHEPALDLVTDPAGWPQLLEARIPNDAGLPYALLLALDSVPGFALSDGRRIPANPDALAFLSLAPGNPILSGGYGLVPATGPAQASLSLPVHPSLAGFRFVASGVTADPGFPDGIRNILAPLAIQLP